MGYVPSLHIFLNRTNRFVFVTNTICVFCKAGIEFLYVLWAHVKFLLQGVKLSRGTKTLQVQLAHCTQYGAAVPSYWTFNSRRSCVRYFHRLIVFRRFRNYIFTQYVSVSVQKEDDSNI